MNLEKAEVLHDLEVARRAIGELYETTPGGVLNVQLRSIRRALDSAYYRVEAWMHPQGPLVGSNDAQMQYEEGLKTQRELIQLKVEKQQLQLERMERWLAEVVHYMHEKDPNVPCKCNCHYFKPQEF